MADAGLFIGWGEVARGREAKSLEVFQEAMAYYAGLEQKGTVESVEAVFLEPHGGDLQGFFLIKGERQKLATLRVDQEFVRMSARAAMVVDGIGVVGASLGDAVQEQVSMFQEVIADLA
jgi:hypothetical protein